MTTRMASIRSGELRSSARQDGRPPQDHPEPEQVEPVGGTALPGRDRSAAMSVTQAFLSLLNANPLRRPSLDTVSRLLACPLLWSPLVQRGGAGGARINDGNDVFRPHLPQDVREMIDTTIRDGLLADPALNTARGVWWEAPEFLSPWWKRPPIIMCIEP
ncbi:hypothetical protein Esi_1845_0001 [Ectocarpus siliculosus]|uniref:Uncharacterized protein n=1 Tax=Ectocarpus siliculosus TaxID=2880 RepID=D7FP26_ECTSI|nr:hypothetical protein Esi_1845_0001 [Ectocarpus siliculosus]|eukprot:CBJ34271.1 hypothetical protein Esi_1845_0001 [Ectocarpus siliculosus]